MLVIISDMDLLHISLELRFHYEARIDSNSDKITHNGIAYQRLSE